MEHNFNIAALLSPPDIMECKRVLCVQPHPDDNEIGMGGIIAALAQRGCKVNYLTVTNGDRGNLDKSASPEETASIRKEEAIVAGQLLGASSFHFLDHSDGSLSDVVELSKEISAVIRKIRPDAIFCPDPWLMYECHMDHIMTGLAVSNALIMGGHSYSPDNESEPWRCPAIGYYYTSNPNTVIDITNTFEQKFEAIALHKSQIDARTLAMYRVYFGMKGEELAQGKEFKLGEGLKVLGQIHTHCFVDAYKI